MFAEKKFAETCDLEKAIVLTNWGDKSAPESQYELAFQGQKYGNPDEDSDSVSAVWRDKESGQFIPGYVAGGSTAIMLAHLPEIELVAAQEKAAAFALECCGSCR